jgi:hypothetical protein
LVGVGVA